MPEKSTRREFLQKTAGAAAAISLASSKVIGANERLRIGGIGTGDRGTDRLEKVKDLGGEIVALADVNGAMLDRCMKRLELKPKTYVDYHDLLARDDIDAVVIASPDHWHHDMLIDSIHAGKDAYIEKPLTRTIEEGKDIVKQVKATDRIVQVGNQRRSGTHWAHARELVEAGKVGEIKFVRTWDCRYRLVDPFLNRAKDKNLYNPERINWPLFLGNTPKIPFDPVRCSAWRWFWDYAGGLMTDIGPHMLDVAHWITGTLGPKSVVCNGGNYWYPGWETPDNVHAILDCGTLAIVFCVQFMNGYEADGAAYYGTEGSIVDCTDGKLRLFDTNDKEIEQWPKMDEQRPHVQNFLDCIKSRKQPNSPPEIGHRVITGAHLANISYRTGMRVEWDLKEEKII
ncbi:MAG TPA: Gfo/Idh/MocA family oxidoreductase [bacterium]|nr:Gfo/Idh/MocA family oxidoreductase [bacterium]HPO07631.1 Gfo/Idh/MocA family oxidoreductase [bacterium]HQP98867.1 Gfo/Idh/MocA family oxidoreductase [bacterium]